MIIPIVPRIRAMTARRVKKFISPVLIIVNVCPIAVGIPDTIPAKIIKEIPFPIPPCVICSPIHIRSIVPASIETADNKIKVL